jgi:glycosyltransferase involved in cell wall biosynthesis
MVDRSDRVVSPLVSVIIPTFNRWPLIRDAVDSVLTQSFRDFELIVVDDGSTDDTSKELAKMAPRLRCVTTTRGGVSAARNFGVGRARGRYIAFLDSDDLWLARKLEKQVAFMERDSSIEICQTEEIWIRNGIRVNPKAIHRKPSGDIFAPSLELCLVSPSAVMMTQDLFEKVGGFDETLPVCEDYDLWLRIAAEHRVPLLDDALVVKRGGHADQLSRSIWGMDRYRIVALQKILRSGLLDDERKAAALAVLRRKAMILARGARKRGREEDARGFEALAEFDRETRNGGSGDPRLRERESFSSADPRALAQLGARG